MNQLDVLLLVLVLAFRGLRRGFVRELFTFAGWLGGALAAVYFLYDLTPIIAERFRIPAAFAGLAAFLAVFLAVSTVLWLVGFLISTLIKVTVLLRPIDKLAGVALGAVEGLTLAGIVLFVFGASPLFPTAREMVESSALGPPVVEATSTLFSSVRDEAVRLRKQADAIRAAEKKAGKRGDAPPPGDGGRTKAPAGG